VLATHGMIATSQPLASAAGLKVLHDGGTVVDAAVTAAAVLAVVEPSMTGNGGDLFAIRVRGEDEDAARARTRAPSAVRRNAC
jgi:gamma-glutamyltranspeptidase/glutathione hydrolase